MTVWNENNPFTFVWLCDGHKADDQPADATWTVFGTDEYRRQSTFDARVEAALTTANAESASFFIQAGDWNDLNNTDPAQVIIDAEAVVAGGAYAGPYLTVIGNHERVFVGSWAADYFANLLGWASGEASYSAWTDNDDDNDAVAGKAYSVDVDGFHVIVLYATTSTHTFTAGQKTWLTTDLAANSLPVIVFTHAWISDVRPAPSNADYANIPNGSDVRTILEADSNVQAVFQAHFHGSHAAAVINDIWYLHGWGSVNAPGATDNAYYLVKIIPDAYYGTSRNRANVKLTRYGTNSRFGIGKANRDYERFLIGSA